MSVDAVTLAAVQPPPQLDVAAGLPPALDAESREWLRSLRAAGSTRDEAVARLHALLLRAARFEVARRRPTLPHLRGDELDDIATEAADDAVVSVLRRLDDFRGASRFTTWAYKFVIFEVSAALRRESWRGRAITLDDGAWERLADAEPTTTQARVEVGELLRAMERSVASDLTPRQRDVFSAVVIAQVPIDVLADRLDSTRGSIYKTLHDARRKLRASLEVQGWLARADTGDVR